jgi:hypothetical protein
MKKVLAVMMIAVLYMMPLAASGQKRAGGPQTKTGKFLVDVEYSAVETFVSTKPSGADKSNNATSTTKLTLRYQASMLVKAMHHDNMTSFIGPSVQAASGEFSYQHSGEEHSVSSDDLHHDMSETAAFHGVISKNDGIGYDLPDSGDGLNSVDSSVSADGSGSFSQQTKDEGYKYDSAANRNVKVTENKTDKSCQTGTAMFLTLQMAGGDPDSTRPPETACTAHFQKGFNIRAKKVASEDSDPTASWPGADSTGGFAAGKYTFSLSNATIMPKDYQADQDGEKRTFTEKLTFTATVNLVAGASAELFSHGELYDRTAILTGDDDDRFLALLEDKAS